MTRVFLIWIQFGRRRDKQQIPIFLGFLFFCNQTVRLSYSKEAERHLTRGSLMLLLSFYILINLMMYGSVFTAALESRVCI